MGVFVDAVRQLKTFSFLITFQIWFQVSIVNE